MVAWSSTIEAAGLDPDWSSILDRNLPGTETFAVDLQPVVGQLRLGASLTPEQGMVLWNHANLATVARLADAAKHARFGEDVFFNSNLHVNQTNICTLACRFCAFRRGPRAADAYALDIQGYLDRIEPFADRIDEVHTVGGLHPEWDITHYETLFRAVKETYPQLHIKALTAVEIKHIAKLSTLSVIELLSRLKSAGLDSLPGGGAEILDDSVRDRICLGKETSQEYLSIHRDAHSIGLPSNCTMLFGTVETPEQRIAHLCSLRQLQSETGGFQCFVPYPYLPDHSRLPDAQLASASEVLRMIAISRLMLDNIPHVKAYRMNLGDHLAELALRHGADDIDGTVGHEEIMHEAGSQTPLDDDRVKLARQIIDAGGRPVQRNTIYTQFRRFDPDDEDLGGMRLPIAMMG